jgi:peptide/nickel transport system substrate-binding protein
VPLPRRLLAALCALLAVPLGARPAGAAVAPHRSVLTVAVSQTVDSLSPFLAERRITTEIHRLIYDFLTDYAAKDASPVGGLAQSWSVSADKLTWTYHLRPGMTWSDGRPVTARDAAFTFRTMMTDPAAATANGNFTAGFAAVDAPDDRTLVIRLKQPQATMLALDVPIVPEHIWRRVRNYASFNNDSAFPVVGDGPFVLTAYRPDQYLELTANPHYWRGRPHVDALVFRYYKDQDAAVEALRKGEVSFVGGLTPAQFSSLRRTPGITANQAAAKRYYALMMNPGATAQDGQRFGDGNPALRDPRVRQAVVRAVDNATLTAKVAQGYAVPGGGTVPPRYPAYHWAPGPTEALSYSPAAADALLDAAGYRRGPDGLRRTPGGEPLTLRLLGHTTVPDDRRAGTYIAEWLRAVGIRTTQAYVDPSRLSDLESAGRYDLALDGWTVNPDPDAVLSLQTCGARPATPGGSGPTEDFVCDPAYDALYARQLAEYDPARRAALVRWMQQRLYSDAYLDVLYYPDALEAYRTDQIASVLAQPTHGGNIDGQDGYWSWWSAVPGPAATAGAAVGPARGSAAGIAAGALVVLGGIAAYAVRRRRTIDERE